MKEFLATLEDSAPPAAASDLIKALWYDANGLWDKAHDLVQDLTSLEASWIHAYLHRKEGDHSNASYWYHRANKDVPMPSTTLEEEWERIVFEIL